LKKENIAPGWSEKVADLPKAIHLAVMEQDVAGFADGLQTVNRAQRWKGRGRGNVGGITGNE
jgi:hypothetical protein